MSVYQARVLTMLPVLTGLVISAVRVLLILMEKGVKRMSMSVSILCVVPTDLVEICLVIIVVRVNQTGWVVIVKSTLVPVLSNLVKTMGLVLMSTTLIFVCVIIGLLEGIAIKTSTSAKHIHFAEMVQRVSIRLVPMTAFVK